MTEADPSLTEDRTSPLGLWMYADSYLDAASCVAAHSRHPHREPVYLLYAHAVEFALKAFLRSKGASIDEIEAHGHRLDPLLGACRTTERNSDAELHSGSQSDRPAGKL